LLLPCRQLLLLLLRLLVLLPPRLLLLSKTSLLLLLLLLVVEQQHPGLAQPGQHWEQFGQECSWRHQHKQLVLLVLLVLLVNVFFRQLLLQLLELLLRCRQRQHQLTVCWHRHAAAHCSVQVLQLPPDHPTGQITGILCIRATGWQAVYPLQQQ
jgi:hypothetical protein